MAKIDGIEFEVSSPNVPGHKHFDTFNEAAGHAVVMGASTGTAHLDVLCWSETAAQAWGGDDAVTRYREDPEASVFERYEVKVNAQGRIA